MTGRSVSRHPLLAVACAFLCVLAGGGSGAQAAPDIRINSITAEEQAEPALVVNPTNPMNLFAAWRDLRAGRAAIGHARSLDGGATWAGAVIDDPQADILYDPSVGADSLGNIYLAFGIDFLPVGSRSETWVLKSTDGGASFGPPVSAGPFIDKPFLGIDRMTDAIYVAGNAVDSRGRGGVFITRSTDGGASFGPLTTVTTRSAGLVNAPAFGPGGEVYLCWPSFGGGRVKVLFNRSLDGGATWLSRAVQVASYRFTGSLLNGGVNAPHLVTIASDRTGGPFAGRIYAVWHQGDGGQDVVLSQSSDGGDTWSATLRVNDDPVASPADQFLPWVNVDDTGGVHVSFLDRRDDPANVNFALYLASSTDGGATFAPNMAVSDGAFPPSPNTTFVGDYNAADARGGLLHAIWADGRNGDLDVFTEAVGLPVP